MATDPTQSNPSNQSTPERREYKRDWMRQFRAKTRQANGVTDVDGEVDGTDYLSQYGEADRAYVKMRVDSLEAQLDALKHPLTQQNLSFTPEYVPHSQQVTDEFSAKIDELERMDGPIGPRKAQASALEKERERIGKQLSHIDKQLFGTRLVAERDKLRGLEQKAENLENMIMLWSPGGRMRQEQEARIAQDRNKGNGQRNSRDPQEQRQGMSLLNALDKKEGEVEVALGRMKAELHTLRG